MRLGSEIVALHEYLFQSLRYEILGAISLGRIVIAKVVETKRGRLAILFVILGLVAVGRKLAQTKQDVAKTSEEVIREHEPTLEQDSDQKMALIGAEHLLRSLERPAPLRVVMFPFFDGHQLTMRRWELPQAPTDPFIQNATIGDGSVPTDEEWETLSNLAPVVSITPRLTVGRAVIPRRLRPTGTDNTPRVQ
jgi:hypothetical protein